jgi:arginyl-tRNA synthetase
VLRDRIETIFKESIQRSIDNGALGELKSVPDSIPVELTKNPEHGDKAISIAMKLTKEAKLAPRAIAESVVANLPNNSFAKVDIAGPGFINLTLNWQLLEEALAEIHASGINSYGRFTSEYRPDKTFLKPLLEYVSANPTGDLHLGHGRQAVLGSALAELLRWGGYEVSTEFYINDAGVQMNKLGESCRMAMMIHYGLKSTADYDHENFYPLESMNEFMSEFVKEVEREHKSAKEFVSSDQELKSYTEFAKNVFLDFQQKILTTVKVEFDNWYSESRNLHSTGDHKVEQVCELLRDKGYVYEEEGALWFKAEDFGDERNRVLRKSDGHYTYLAADYAYHLDKISRGYDKLINLWGADHHGQVPGMKGGLQALGKDAEFLEVILVQMVSLTKDGQEVKMSKRSGNVVTVKDLVEEVGVDAFRYFLVESQANNRIVFDLELAKKQDKDNPVYYIQYAHARTCSILRNLVAKQVNQNSELGSSPVEDAILSANELSEWLDSFKKASGTFAKSFDSLSKEELASTKALILSLVSFPDELREAVLNRAPYKIAVYLRSLAGLFHQFYTHNRVISDNKDLMKARLSLVEATRIVLYNALTILGISAPESM